MRDRSTFERLRTSPSRARSGPVSVVLAATDAAGSDERAEPPVRIAFSIGRRFGNAVERNRMRRRIRSIVRDAVREGLVPTAGAYLIRVDAAAGEATHTSLKEHVELAMAEVQERCR